MSLQFYPYQKILPLPKGRMHTRRPRHRILRPRWDDAGGSGQLRGRAGAVAPPDRHCYCCVIFLTKKFWRFADHFFLVIISTGKFIFFGPHKMIKKMIDKMINKALCQ